MSKDVIKHTVDLTKPEPLTAAQKAQLEALAKAPDSDVDTSDISELPEAFWKDAVRNPFYKPRKTSTTVRIDADILAWLRAGGPGYQSRINAILRRAMLSSIKS